MGGQARGLCPPPAAPRSAPPWIAAVSGKGGVGKTNVVANLAVAAAGLGARVLLVDGDLGLANVDVLLGLLPPASVAEVLDGRSSLEEALVDGPRGIRVLPAASARAELAALDGLGLARLIALLRAGTANYDLVLFDAGAGIGPSVLGLAAACSRVLVVTNGEPTSLADAYAVFKVLHAGAPPLPVELLVNEVRDAREARAVQRRLERVVARFLAAPVPLRGYVPRDPRLAEAVSRQRAVVDLYPGAASSRRLVALARDLLREGAAAPRPRPRPSTTQETRP